MRISPTTRLATLFRRFGQENDGQVAIIFGVALLSLLSTVGIALDYSRSARQKSAIDAAADSAALVAVTTAANSPVKLVPSGAIDYDATKAKGIQQATAFFDLQAKEKGILASASRTVELEFDKRTGAWSSKITYSASLPSSFGGIVGITDLNYAGKASASVAMATSSFMDIHLLLDNSSSMGIGATAADIASMKALTGCAFGCHVGAYKATYYDLPKSKGIQMRIDVLRSSTQSLIDTAKAANQNNNVRMSLYTFNDQLHQLTSLTNGLDSVRAVAGTVDLPTYDDGTFTAKAMNELTPQVSSSGDGSETARAKQFVFMVTDGVEDGIYIGNSKPNAPGPYGMWNSTSAIDPHICDALKSKGVTVAVLYTKYIPFAGTWQYDGLIAPFAANIPANLKACATSGFFFEATSAAEIDAAMQAMFQSAVKATAVRLTQ